MTAVITLTDVHNGCDDGGIQMTAPVPECIRYLDGPARLDPLPASRWAIRAAIDALRSGNLDQAKFHARQVGIYLTAASDHIETVAVQPLGEDCDEWVVTGTTDAHSAEEAVRAHYQWAYGESLEHAFGEDHVELSISRRELMRWSNLNDEGLPDERSRLLQRYRWALASCDQLNAWWPLSAPFSGFMVQA